MKIIEQHTVPAIDVKIRLQEYASTVFKSISTRSGIKKAIKRKELFINGQPAETSDWIEEGQLIQLLQAEEGAKKIFRLKLSVVYEDEFIALIHKVAGYPTNGNYFKTIENALSYNLKSSSQPDALNFPKAAHRLDNPTSGLLLIGKTRQSLSLLQQAFEEKKIKKSYLAIVSGVLPENGIYKNPIDGKSAETHFKRLKTFHKNMSEFSLVELFPVTGRTHQLRKHLSENGFPIVGDLLYDSEINLGKSIFLTAYSLSFIHPIFQKEQNFQSAIPKKFRKFIESGAH